MPKLPVVSGPDLVRAFERAGWVIARQRGSHVIMLKPGHIASLSIPMHKSIAPGTLRSLLRISGITLEDMLGLL